VVSHFPSSAFVPRPSASRQTMRSWKATDPTRGTRRPPLTSGSAERDSLEPLPFGPLSDLTGGVAEDDEVSLGSE
jgi:hypothetical protein